MQWYLQVLHDMNLKQIVSGQTRPESGSQLDHVLARCSDDVSAARVVPCAWSDHDLVITETPVSRTRQRTETVGVRSTRSLAPASLCLDLLLEDWSAMYEASRIGAKWVAWLTAWSPNVDKHITVKQIRLRHPPGPWLTDNSQLRALMRHRDLAKVDCAVDRSPGTCQTYCAKRSAVRGAQCRVSASVFLSSYKFSRKTT